MCLPPQKCTSSTSNIIFKSQTANFLMRIWQQNCALLGVCNEHLMWLYFNVMFYRWKSWQRGHLGLPVDLHTQGTRPLIFLSPPPPLSALQLLVAEHFTKRAYMQCCKPAIRQEGNSQAPRPGTCPAHFGQGVHEAIFCPFLLSTLEWFKRALSPIQIRFTTNGWGKLGAPTVQRL